MIPNHWYAILDSREVRDGRPIGVRRLGERLALWRDTSGQAVCMRDQCPHRGAALSIGKLAADRIVCPFHGFEFDPAGRCQLIPANGRTAGVPKAFQVSTLPALDRHGFIWVWWGDPARATGEPPWFETIDDRFVYSTLSDSWPVHYTRAIENQLDVVHLPFVHFNTIGRGNRALVNGPLVRWENGRRMNLWVSNDVDQGQAPLRPEDMAEPSRHPSLQFDMPNTWHNWIAEDVRITAAFAPVDEGNTVIYVRFYQKSLRLPLLGRLFAEASMPFNRLILNQDKRVVLTQRPIRTDLRMGEKLIQGDGPIVAFRRRREELMAGVAAGPEPPPGGGA
jgi:phenylpropionate dioxygenase-like ring-hydroxylating dioxygenase large terminal subunit